MYSIGMVGSTLLLSVLVLQSGTRITPFAVYTGAQSKITTPSTSLIRSQSNWSDLWRRHKGYSTVSADASRREPKIDFNRHMVVAITMGTTERCRGFIVSPAPYGVYDEGSKLSVRYRYNWRSGVIREEETTPFLFIVVPKSAKAIDLVLNDTEDPTTPPNWKVMGTLNAPK